MNGDIVKGEIVMGVGGGRMGNHGTSEIRLSQAESSGRSNELTEGMVTVEVGSLVQNLTSRIEKELSCIENSKNPQAA